MNDAMNPVVLSCRGLQKTYRQGGRGNAEVPPDAAAYLAANGAATGGYILDLVR